MKLHLPKKLFVAVMAALSAFYTLPASALYVVGCNTVTDDADVVFEKATTYPGYDIHEYVRPVVIETTDNAPLRFADELVGKTYDAYMPIYVREGQFIMTDGIKFVYREPDNGAMLQVGGKNASMLISNGASFTEEHTYYGGYLNIGGPDGGGKLELTSGGSLYLDKSLTAGYFRDADWSSAQTVFATYDGAERYLDGDYETVTYTAADNSELTRQYGKATIIIDGDDNNSSCDERTTMEVGTAMFLAHADVTVKNGALINLGTRLTDAQNKPELTYNGWEGCNILGRQHGCTANLSIVSGGEINITGSLISSYSDVRDAKINISIDGKATEDSANGVEKGTPSRLTVSHILGLGVGSSKTAGKTTTKMDVVNGAEVHAGNIHLGLDEGRVGTHKATINVDKESCMIADNLFYVSEGAKLTNEGSIYADTFELRSGGVLTMGGNATINATSMAMQKDSAFSYVLTNDNAPVILTDGTMTMESGSAFELIFTEEYLAGITLTETALNIVIASGAAEGSSAQSSISYKGLDEEFWSVENLAWSAEDGNVSLTGTLTYKTTIDTSDKDAIDTEITDTPWNDSISVDITNDITLSGDNSYSGGTTVTGATVTLGSENALGNGGVTTSGFSTLVTDADLTADVKGELAVNDGSLTMSGNFNIDGAVENKGELTMEGNIATTGKITNDGTLNLSGSNAISQTIANNGLLNLNGAVDATGIATNAINETHIGVDGQTGSNGFKRDEGSSFQLAANGADATIGTGEDLVVTHNGTQYVFDSSTGIAYAHGSTHLGTYFINTEDHAVSASAIDAASNGEASKVEMQAGTLTADSDVNLQATGGTLETVEGTVSGSIADTSIAAKGGNITASIIGESSLTVTGSTTLAGENTYSGDTVIKGEDAKLVLDNGSSLGSGKVLLDNHGMLDLGGNAISNYINVTGCTLKGAGAYTGQMDVSGNLELVDATSASKVVMQGNGSIKGAPLTTTELSVETNGNATIDGDLTINDNGTLTLNDGKVLTVGGSLTLGNGTSLVLNGDYAAGDKLLTCESGVLTLGVVTLVYGDSTMEVEVQGGSLVLVSLFKQPYAESLVLNNWGMLTGSRSFVNAVRGQRTNTGCIANGRGTAWVAVLGASHDLDGGDIDLQGSAIGADMKVGAASSVGVAFGYTEIDATPSGLSKVKQEGSYMALYGEHGLKKLSSTSCLSMDWVAAYGQTESKLHGQKWEQESLQLNTRLSWNKKVNDRLCVSVFGGVEYYTNESDTVDGVKTGSIQNLRGEVGVGARYVAWGTPSVSDGKMGILKPGCEKLVLHGELRYMNDMVRSNPVVRMSGMSGVGENPGRQGVGIEAGATYRFSQRWSASANYGINTMGDSREHRVNVGASFTF